MAEPAAKPWRASIGALEQAVARRASRQRKAGVRGVRLARKVAGLIRWERVCRVATAAEDGEPHVVPVCHVLDEGTLYFGSGRDARKVRDISANARVAVSVDLYSDDWKHLKGVMIQGTARVISGGAEFRRARRLLYLKYPQYPEEAALEESDSVVVAVTPTHVFAWGLD